MKIINVFKTHFDIGFTDLSENIVNQYGTKMLPAVLDACEKSENRPIGKRFVWTMSSWPLIKALEKCSITDYARATKYLKNGQLCFHALPYTLHTESLSIGDLPHLFDSAKTLCETFHLEFPISAKMTDVPGHTMALISPLCKAGVKFLHLGCNPASTPPKVPTIFWWENKIGERILVFYNGTYGSSVLPPENWKYPVWLSVQQTGDNIGPQDVSELDNIEKNILEKCPNAEVEFGKLDDFYNEIIKCDLSDLPTIKQDLGDSWIHGIGTYPKEVSMMRRSRNIASKSKMTEEDEKEFYENSLLFSEHTWGLDVKTFLGVERSYNKEKFKEERKKLPKYALMEKSWDEQRNRAKTCMKIAEKYGKIYEDFPKTSLETDKYLLFVKDEKIHALNKQTNREISIDYQYKIISQKTMNAFMENYLTDKVGWAISDFSRENYDATIEDKTFGLIFKSCECKNGLLSVKYLVDKSSFETYGNAKEIEILVGICDDKIILRVLLKQKEASPIVESGDLFIHTNCKGENFTIKKLDCTLDVTKDICENANQILYCVSDSAKIDDVEVNPIDAPLVSFGESATFHYNCGTYRKPKQNSLVFNLFNTQWGTNFPQWLEGDFQYDFVVKI